MLNAIKKWALKRELRKRMMSRKRNAAFFNFHTAKTVGIIFVYDAASIQALQDLTAFLTSRNIECNALCYYLEKEQPATTAPELQFFGKREVNWLGKCLSPAAGDFIGRPFDILIDFTVTPVPPVRYLSVLSLAKMKVGRKNYPGHPYDFVLASGNAATALFVEDLKHYLLTIDMKN